MWNFDEKGFLIGLIQKAKRIILLESLQKGRIRGHRQDGSREFITLIACVSALGQRMPPSLIYAGESGDLQNTWVQDIDLSSQKAFFATSPTGWTNNNLGMAWLERFNQETAVGN